MPAGEYRSVQTGVRSILEWILDAIMVVVLVGVALRGHGSVVRAIVVVAIALVLFGWFLRLRRWHARKQVNRPEGA